MFSILKFNYNSYNCLCHKLSGDLALIRYYSSDVNNDDDDFDPSILDHLNIVDNAVLKKQEHVSKNFYWNLYSDGFNDKRFYKMSHILKKNMDKLVNNNSDIKYTLHVYILIEGKKSNYLPKKAKTDLQNVLDSLNRIDLNLLHYSALNKFCDDFRKLKSSLSNRITVTDFNDDIITDNRLISKKVQAAADTIIREYYRNKPLTCFVHLKKMKNLTKEALTDAILLNSSLDEINSQLDNITPTPRDTSKTKTKKPSSSS